MTLRYFVRWSRNSGRERHFICSTPRTTATRSLRKPVNLRKMFLLRWLGSCVSGRRNASSLLCVVRFFHTQAGSLRSETVSFRQNKGDKFHMEQGAATDGRELSPARI